MLLDFSTAPDNPVERIVWLDELYTDMHTALYAQLQSAYFEARLRGQLAVAIEVAPHGKKKVLAMTRAENEKRGRCIRWGSL